jgi:RNA polymerase sigma factor (sigma-70 family)
MASDYTTTPDTELEQLAAGGDRDAFAELYSRHFDKVYDFSLRILRDRDDAADVAQETFMKAMAALSPKQKRAAFSTWLFTIARNTALNRLRSRKTTPQGEGDDERPYARVDESRLASPEQAAQARELADLVWQAAAALDAKQYSVLDLHLRQGLESAEIAEVLRTSKNNAYVMMNRLKNGLEESVTTLVMARRGRRECADLNALLSEGTSAFDARTRKLVSRHIESCPTCQEQRRRLVSPAALFGAFAAAPVPVGLKEKALADLLGGWASIAGSEAGKAGGMMGRLFRRGDTGASAGRAGFLAGWKGVALVVGALVMAGGIGGGLVLSGALGGGNTGTPRTDASGVPRDEAAQAAPTITPTPTSVPTPTPTAVPLTEYEAFKAAFERADDLVGREPADPVNCIETVRVNRDFSAVGLCQANYASDPAVSLSQAMVDVDLMSDAANALSWYQNHLRTSGNEQLIRHSLTVERSQLEFEQIDKEGDSWCVLSLYALSGRKVLSITAFPPESSCSALAQDITLAQATTADMLELADTFLGQLREIGT